jgi:hypothetical protein
VTGAGDLAPFLSIGTTGGVLSSRAGGDPSEKGDTGLLPLSFSAWAVVVLLASANPLTSPHRHSAYCGFTPHSAAFVGVSVRALLRTRSVLVLVPIR